MNMKVKIYADSLEINLATNPLGIEMSFLMVTWRDLYCIFTRVKPMTFWQPLLFKYKNLLSKKLIT